MTARMVIGTLGVAAAAYGAWMLLDDPLSALVEIALWLVAGVLLHDAVLAPLAALAGTLSRRWVPDPFRGPVAVGALVVAATTLVAIPVLGRFGASPGNPTLLDRDYVAGWTGIVALVAAGVALAGSARTVRRRRGADPGR